MKLFYNIRLRKTIAIIALIAMFLTMFPYAVFAAADDLAAASARVNTSAVSSAEEDEDTIGAGVKLDGLIVGEETSEREENVKTYRLSNGLMYAVEYQGAVHYKSTDDQWLDIDNSLNNDTKSGRLQTKDGGSMQADFAVNSTTKGTESLINYGNESIKIGMSPAAATKGIQASYENNQEADKAALLKQYQNESISADQYNMAMMTLPKVSSRVYYKNIINKADLEYIVTANGVKEYIVANEKSDQYEYLFNLNFEGLVPYQIDKHTIGLYSGVAQRDAVQETAAEANPEESAAAGTENSEENPELSTEENTVAENNTEENTAEENSAEENAAEEGAADENTIEENAPEEELPDENTIEDNGLEENTPEQSNPAANQENAAGNENTEEISAENTKTTAEGTAEGTAEEASPAASEEGTEEADKEAGEETAAAETTAAVNLTDVPEGAQLEYELKASYMMDANCQDSDAVYAELIYKDGKYQVKITADAQWINGEDIVFPVKIDPTIVSKQVLSDYTCVSVSSEGDRKSDYMKVGNSTEQWKSIIKFDDLPTLSAGEQIISSSFILVEMTDPTIFSSLPDEKIEAHLVKGSWNKNTITLETMPESQNEVSAIDTCKPANDVLSLDITTETQGWYEGTYANHGMELRIHEATYEGNRIYTYYADDGVAGRPLIIISYLDTNGFDSQWSYHTVSNDYGGSVSVNDLTGHTIHSYTDATVAGNIGDITVSHVHNQSEKSSAVYGSDMKFGEGWRLNIIETVKAVTNSAISEDYPYVYTDGDGTDHYFMENSSGEYVMETDDTIKLTTVSSGYKITDERGNITYFCHQKGSTNVYYMTSKVDLYGTKCSYLYNSSHQLKYYDIMNESNSTTTQRILTLNYNSNKYLTSIVDEYGRTTTYSYGTYNGHVRLVSVTAPEGTTTFTYGSNGGPSIYHVTAPDGGKISCAYWEDRAPYRCKKITEVGSSGSTGNYLSFAYDLGNTTVTDKQGNQEIMQFDYLGRTVCVNDEEGNALFGNYSDINGQKNMLTTSSSLQATIKNYVMDSSAESGGLWSTKSTGLASGAAASSLTRATDNHYLGAKSFKLQKNTAAAGSTYAYQDLTVTPGKTYTLSAYLKITSITTAAEGGVYLEAGYGSGTNADNYTYVQGEVLNATTDWAQYSITIDVPADNSKVEIRVRMKDAYGTVYFDAVQFEEGSVVNEYNLIQNGSFDLAHSTETSRPAYWGRSTTSNTTNDIITTAQSGYGHSGNVVRLRGQVLNSVYMYQTIYASGSAGDSYVLGGWGHSYAFQNDDDGPLFAVGIRFYNADGAIGDKWINAQFNSNSYEWQFSSVEAVAPANYTHMRVRLVLNKNVNNAEYDDIQLFNNSFGTSYKYGTSGVTKGKITKAVSGEKNTAAYAYYSSDSTTGRKGELQSITYKKGSTTIGSETYQYNAQYDVTKSTNISGIVTVNSYYDDDGERGNLKETIKKDSNGTIQLYSINIYTSDFRFLTKTTDSRGNSVQYTTSNGKTTKVTDANSGVMNYTYNSAGKLAGASGTAQVNGTNAALSNAYTYSNSRLNKIQVNTGQSDSFAYNFGYNQYGDLTTVSAGSNSLMTNAYCSGNHEALDTTSYANGQSLKMGYDNLWRVNSTQYRDTASGSYTTISTADYNAAGEVGRTTDLQNGTYTRYLYDQSGKLKSTIVGSLEESGSGTYNADQDNAITYRGERVYNSKNLLSRLNFTLQNYNPSGEKRYVTYTYTSDGKNLLSKLSLQCGINYNYTYDSLARVSSRVMSGGSGTVTEDYSYLAGSASGRTTLLTENMNITGLQSPGGAAGYYYKYKYSYDKNGNVSSIQKFSPSSSSYVLAVSYAYDAQNQLVRENNNEAQVTYLYRYSANGNMLQKQYYDYTVSTATPATTDLTQIDYYTYASGSGAWSDVIASTYTEYYSNGTLSSTSAANNITTDAIGNVTASDGWTYTWTMGNRLAAMENDDMRLTFAYNQDGKRVKKTVTDYTNNNAVTTYNYQWDNDMLIAMRMVSATQDITQLYYYDPNGNPVSIRQYLDPNSSTSCANYFYLHDAQNNVIGLCGTSGRVCGEYFYDSWGKETAAPAGEYAVRNLNPIRYKDYLYDSETGLYCTGSRYYNPEWGRFLSIDSLETLNANTSGALVNDNLFIYCNNNPITFEDSDGEFVHILISAAVSAGFEALGQLTEGKEMNVAKIAFAGLSGAATAVCGPVLGAAIGGATEALFEAVDGKPTKDVILAAVLGSASSFAHQDGLRNICGIGKKITNVGKTIKSNNGNYLSKLKAGIEKINNSSKASIETKMAFCYNSCETRRATWEQNNVVRQNSEKTSWRAFSYVLSSFVNYIGNFFKGLFGRD